MATGAGFAAEDVPGELSEEDRKRVALGFNSLCSRDASVHSSALRIVDTLDTRYLFIVTHPRNLDAAALRSLRLKLKRARSVILDIPNRRVSVECWRHNSADPDTALKKRGTKRRRPIKPLDAVPEYIQTTLAGTAQREDHLNVLSKIMLWIVNYNDFCAFDFSAERDESKDAYNLRLAGFDAVPDTFVNTLLSQWRSFVKDVVVCWSSRTLTVCVQCD